MRLRGRWESFMLGECEKCQGALCVSGREVVCERCGHPHPKALAALGGAAPAGGSPPAPVLPAQDFAVTVADRVLSLEKVVTRLSAEVDQLKAAAGQPAAGRRR